MGDSQMAHRKWPILITFSLFLIVGAVACRNQVVPAAVVAPESAVLTDLESIEQLEVAFNEDSGRPRLIMILAPL